MTQTVLIIITFAIAGWIQGVLGFGFVIATTLILVNSMDLSTLVFLNLAISVVTSGVAFLSAKNIKILNKPILLKLVVSATLGLIIGVYIMNYVNSTILKQVTLIIILIASILSLTKTQKLFSHKYMLWFSGFISGVLTPSTGINGPPVVLHLNAALKNKAEIRVTMLAFLFLIMAFGLISLVIQPDFGQQNWITAAKLSIPSVAGYLLGLLTFRKMPDKVFQKFVLYFLISTSAAALINLFL